MDKMENKPLSALGVKAGWCSQVPENEGDQRDSPSGRNSFRSSMCIFHGYGRPSNKKGTTEPRRQFASVLLPHKDIVTLLV
ncbi:hypothetical protein VTO42DRAFT_8766 [Malbranchea cinnamomea]